MPNHELVPVELYGANNDGEPRRYTIADGVTVSKGTLLALIDPRVASYAIVTSVMCAGIAKEDHVAGQNVLSISAWTNGIFESYASGAIAVGAAISVAGPDSVQTATAGASGAMIIGYSLEAAGDLEKVNVRILL